MPVRVVSSMCIFTLSEWFGLASLKSWWANALTSKLTWAEELSKLSSILLRRRRSLFLAYAYTNGFRVCEVSKAVWVKLVELAW